MYNTHLILVFVAVASGFIHDISIRDDDRNSFFISNFGFFSGGRIEISMRGKEGTKIGFLIKVSNSDHSQDLNYQRGSPCPLEKKDINDISVPVVYSNSGTFYWNYTVPQDGLYKLFFVNCKGEKISFTVSNLLQFLTPR